MLSSRQKLILKQIVESYVKDGIPVGSKALTNLPYLSFSSATIRYDMAFLEEYGYLEKTHTSSGRVPSEKGYKYYVDHLITRNDEVLKDYPLIDSLFYENRYTKDLALEKAIDLLSELTNYTALAIGPSNDDSKISKIDFIPVSEITAVILIVTNKGHVQHQNITVPSDISMSELRKVIQSLDELLVGKYLFEASKILKDKYAKKELSDFIIYQERLLHSFIHAFAQFAHDNFYLSGVSNIFDQPEFNNLANVKKLVDMLDKREVVKLLDDQTGLKVRFGSELQLVPLENCTLISVPYLIDETKTGAVAVLGPTRMEYDKVIPLLEYIASNIGKLYKK